MRFLKSGWGLGCLAVVLGLGTSAGVIYKHKDSLLAGASPAKTAIVEPPPILWSFKFQEIENLFDELKAQRKKLDEREAELEKSGAQVASERSELAKLRTEIETLRTELTQTIVEVQENEVKNLKALAHTYASLSPQAAVAIFTEMDETMAVKILALMKADRVGAVFQEMARNASKDPELAKRAAKLSDRLRLLKPIQKESSL